MDVLPAAVHVRCQQRHQRDRELPAFRGRPARLQQRRQDRGSQAQGLEVVGRGERGRSVRDLLHEHGQGGEGNLVRLRAGSVAGQCGVLQGDRSGSSDFPAEPAVFELVVHLQPVVGDQPDAAGLGCHQPGRQAGQRRLQHRQRGRRLGQVQGGLQLPHRPSEDRLDVRDQPIVAGGRRSMETVELQHRRQRDDRAEHRLFGQPQAESCRRSSSCRSLRTPPSTRR